MGDNGDSGRQDGNTVEAQTAGGRVRDKWEGRRKTKWETKRETRQTQWETSWETS